MTRKTKLRDTNWAECLYMHVTVRKPFVRRRFGLLPRRKDENTERVLKEMLWFVKTGTSGGQLRTRYYINWRIKNQLDVTWYFIVLLIGSTCFGHYYAHQQELATMMLITTLVVSFLVCCRLEVRCGQAGVVSWLQPGHYSSPMW